MEDPNLIPFFGIKRQYAQLRDELLDASDRVYRTGQVLDGEQTKAFESAIARRCNREYAIAVNSATQGLVFAMGMLVRIRDVIVPNVSFSATVNSVVMSGHNPRFVDTDHKGLIDLSTVDYNFKEENIGAIMYVNLFGNVVDYDKFRVMTEFFGEDLYIVEDAAQSFGAKYRDIPSGKMGDVSVLSFDPTKNLPNYGSGGMVLTDNVHYAEFFMNMRDNGKHSGQHSIGTNSKMSESDCAQMLVKLNYFDEWQRRRTEIAEYYISSLYQYVDIIIPSEHVTHAWHKFVIRVSERAKLQQHLKEHRVDTRIHYPVALSDFGSIQNNDGLLRESHQFCRESLSLPIYPELTDIEVEHIVTQVKNYYKNY